MKDNLEKRIYTYSTFLEKKFSRKVFRVGLSTGIKCPNRINNGGCIFCNPETFTGEYQSQDLSIVEQLDDAIPRIKKSCGDVGLLAYFQDETSTAGDIEFLKSKFFQALSHPEILGLIVSTRPDFVKAETVKMLQSFKAPVTIEIRMQSVHDKSLDFLNRNHNFLQTQKVIELCGEAGLDVGVHLIIGIPNESFDDMLQTIKYVSSNHFIKQVKFHNLVVYKNTKLSEMKNIFSLSIDEYIDILSELIPFLRRDIVISRLFTSNIRKSQIAVGNYEGSKPEWLNKLRLKLIEKNYSQGCKTDKIYDFDWR